MRKDAEKSRKIADLWEFTEAALAERVGFQTIIQVSDLEFFYP